MAFPVSLVSSGKSFFYDMKQAYTEITALMLGGLGAGTLGATVGFTDAITAFAGGGQTSAVLLTTKVNRVTVVGSAADSVKLPVWAANMVVTVINDAAANSLQLFGNGTDTIDAIATGTGVAIAATKRRICIATTANKWISILSA